MEHSKLIRNDRSALLHILRNPAGWNEETVRDARQKAAAELERLWRVEASAQYIASELAEAMKTPA